MLVSMWEAKRWIVPLINPSCISYHSLCPIRVLRGFTSLCKNKPMTPKALTLPLSNEKVFFFSPLIVFRLKIDFGVDHAEIFILRSSGAWRRSSVAPFMHETPSHRLRLQPRRNGPSTTATSACFAGSNQFAVTHPSYKHYHIKMQCCNKGEII